MITMAMTMIYNNKNANWGYEKNIKGDGKTG